MTYRYIIERPKSGEEWRSVPGFPEFRISNSGRLRNDVGLIRPSHKVKGGYAYNRFRDGDVIVEFMRARLVLLAFVGPAPKEKDLACHRNDNPTDDRLENLYWGSKRDNGLDAVRNGRFDQVARGQAISVAKKGVPATVPPWNKGLKMMPQHIEAMRIGRWGR